MSRPALGSTGPHFKYIGEALSLGVKQPGREVTTYHHLVARLWMSGTVPPLLYFHVICMDSLIFIERYFIRAGFRGKFITFNVDVLIVYMNSQARVASNDWAVGNSSGRHWRDKSSIWYGPPPPSHRPPDVFSSEFALRRVNFSDMKWVRNPPSLQEFAFAPWCVRTVDVDSTVSFGLPPLITPADILCFVDRASLYSLANKSN